MKKIFVQISDSVFSNNAFFAKSQNNMSAPWQKLQEKVRVLGYDMTTADSNNIRDCERIIFMNATSLGEKLNFRERLKNLIKQTLGIKTYPRYPNRNLYKEAIDHGMKDKIILCMWENRAVCPANYSIKIWAKFNKIITWDDDLVDNKKFLKYFPPGAAEHTLMQIKPFASKKLLVNISYNKYSTYYAELYSARRKTIAYFDKHFPNDFDLYGPRWNMPITRLQIMFPGIVKKYSTYRGKTDDKQETASNYRFNLAYENNGDANGYITEKIFDVICAKSVPIYLGAPNVTKYIPEGVFIDRRKFKNDNELGKYLKNMTEEEYNKYISAGEKFLQSKEYYKFTSENFCDKVIEMLDLKPIN